MDITGLDTLLAGVGSLLGGLAAIINSILSSTKRQSSGKNNSTSSFTFSRTQMVVLIVGLVFIFIGNIALWLYFRRDSSLTHENPCEEYGIRILSPKNGEPTSRTTTVQGTFTKLISKDDIQIFVKKTRGEDEYWPKDRDFTQIDSDTNTWEWTGDLGINADAPIIMVALVGESGRILTDYYEHAGRETQEYPSLIKLTSDIIECSSITVTPAE